MVLLEHRALQEKRRGRARHRLRLHGEAASMTAGVLLGRSDDAGFERRLRARNEDADFVVLLDQRSLESERRRLCDGVNRSCPADVRADCKPPPGDLTPDDEGEAGCACRQVGPPASHWGWDWLACLLVIRRRRERSSD